MTIREVIERFRAEAEAARERVPGFGAGIYHGGEQAVMATGVANIATQQPMTEATGFLAGSITKVMTATLAMQRVESGELDLEAPLSRYLPDFALAPPSNTAALRVRHLLNHTNGIDADFFCPDGVSGPGALAHLASQLRRCGALFAPGDYVSYSNAGMAMAGRVLEVVSGRSYHELLERDLFAPVGMADSTTSLERAIVRPTAVGHFYDPKSARLRRTDMFMLPESWSACGSTPIATIADVLAFGRTHLADGVAPTRARVVSAESAQRMRTITADLRSPNSSPIGLGWPCWRFGDTDVLVHSGASPGGLALLVVVPAQDFAFAAFGNSSAAMPLIDKLALWLLRDHLQLACPALALKPHDVPDLSDFAGTYRADQVRIDVRVIDGQLEETFALEPVDAAQARVLGGFMGGVTAFPPLRLVPVGERLFAPAGIPLDAFEGFGGRMLVSFHGDTAGQPTHRLAGGRMSRRVA